MQPTVIFCFVLVARGCLVLPSDSCISVFLSPLLDFLPFISLSVLLILCTSICLMLYLMTAAGCTDPWGTGECAIFNHVKTTSFTMLVLPLLLLLLSQLPLRCANLVPQLMYSTIFMVPRAFAVEMGCTSTSKFSLELYITNGSPKVPSD